MWMILLAQTSEGTSQVLQLVNYGVLGLAILGAVFGFVAFKPEIQRLLGEIERQHSQVDSLIAVYEEKVIPVLVEANHTLARLAEERRRRPPRWEEDDPDDDPGEPRAPRRSPKR